MHRPIQLSALPLRVHRLDPAAPAGAPAWTPVSGDDAAPTAVTPRVRDSLVLRVVRCGKIAAARLVPDAAQQR